MEMELSTTCSWRENIPSELYRQIRDFLKGREYWNLMITSKELFETIAYETRIISLNIIEISDFAEKDHCRKEIYRKIKLPYEQLFLHSHPAGLYRLVAYPGRLIVLISPLSIGSSPLGQIIGNSEIRERTSKVIVRNIVIETLGEVFYNLKSLRCDHCLSFSNSLACLGFIEKVTIQDSVITTANGLGNINSLRLLNIATLMDISSLTNNYELTVLNCPNVSCYPVTFHGKHLETDLLSLALPQRMKGPVRSLTLSYSLSNHHPDAITSLLPKYNSFLYKLKIQADGLYLIPSFLWMKSLTLHCCWDLVDLSRLALPILHLNQPHLRRLVLSRCPKISNISMLGYLEDLEIYDCSGICSLFGLEKVPRITLQGTGLSSLPLDYRGSPDQIIKFQQ